jgi:hypothetical protein
MLEHPLAARFCESLGAFARIVLYDKRGEGLSDRLYAVAR